jgi:hypothetical protein
MSKCMNELIGKINLEEKIKYYYNFRFFKIYINYQENAFKNNIVLV